MKKNRDKRPLPSSSDLTEGARLALINARRHLRVAELMGDERLFGPASTHVILALEELAKSLLLTFITMGVDVPKNLLADVMNEHRARQSLTFGLLFSKVIRNLVFTAMARAYRSGSGGLLERIEKELQKEVKLAHSRRRGTNSHTAILEWIADANDIKNHGLYVDFDGQTWRHPGNVSKKRFVFGYRIAEELIREKGRILRKVHKTGFQVDEQFKALMRDAVANTSGSEREELLKKMVALVLA
jgi:AbiV family abortive infection protein